MILPLLHSQFFLLWFQPWLPKGIPLSLPPKLPYHFSSSAPLRLNKIVQWLLWYGFRSCRWNHLRLGGCGTEGGWSRRQSYPVFWGSGCSMVKALYMGYASISYGGILGSCVYKSLLTIDDQSLLRENNSCVDHDMEMAHIYRRFTVLTKNSLMFYRKLFN